MAITATRKEKIFGLLFLVIIGIGLICISYHEASMAHAAKSWPPRRATIIESKVETSGQGKNSESFFLLKAAYEDNGRTFRVRRIAYGHIRSGEPEATVRHYPKGTKVTVYVNPDDSSDHVLDIQPDEAAMMWVMLVGCGLILLSVLGFLVVKVKQ